MSDSHSAAPEPVELGGGFQLFAEPERDWLTLACRGSVHPIKLAERALHLLAHPLDTADSDDIVLTIDCVGAEWEAHVELTKGCLTRQRIDEQINTILSTMPNRFDEYLSTTFNITDVATLFASATDDFHDAHALVSVPFREVKRWIDAGDMGSSPPLEEQVAKLVRVLTSMLGEVEQYGSGTWSFQSDAMNWRVKDGHVANQLIEAISLRG